MNEKFSQNDKQYIATINQNQVTEVRRHLSEEEFKNIIEDNTILNLTDDDEKGKLLGITIELG